MVIVYLSCKGILPGAEKRLPLVKEIWAQHQHDRGYYSIN